MTNDLSIENMGVKYIRFTVCVYRLLVPLTNHLCTGSGAARILTTTGETNDYKRTRSTDSHGVHTDIERAQYWIFGMHRRPNYCIVL